ncbi:MAG: dihydroorotate dehydrogenase electron transfer subunit [Promethearchaeota archaeon]
MNNVNRYSLPICLPMYRKYMENDNTAICTFLIPEKNEIGISPGQYFMLWLPGNDEIPIAINYYQKNKITFAICGVGSTTNKILQLEQNSILGLRGPFGKGFILDHNRDALIIAGGIGIAPLRFLLHQIIKNTAKPRKIVLLYGAKTKSGLLFRKEFEQLFINVDFCTEDGSHGFSGLVSEKMDNFLQDPLNKQAEWEIYSCGPELMLKKVLSIAQKHDLEKNTQICLADRYIRCGFGICGSCFLDDVGLSICQDGPVFRGDVLLQVKDFGKFGRSADGSKYPFT